MGEHGSGGDPRTIFYRPNDQMEGVLLFQERRLRAEDLGASRALVPLLANRLRLVHLVPKDNDETEKIIFILK